MHAVICFRFTEKGGCQLKNHSVIIFQFSHFSRLFVIVYVVVISKVPHHAAKCLMFVYRGLQTTQLFLRLFTFLGMLSCFCCFFFFTSFSRLV